MPKHCDLLHIRFFLISPFDATWMSTHATIVSSTWCTGAPLSINYNNNSLHSKETCASHFFLHFILRLFPRVSAGCEKRAWLCVGIEGTFGQLVTLYGAFNRQFVCRLLRLIAASLRLTWVEFSQTNCDDLRAKRDPVNSFFRWSGRWSCLNTFLCGIPSCHISPPPS